MSGWPTVDAIAVGFNEGQAIPCRKQLDCEAGTHWRECPVWLRAWLGGKTSLATPDCLECGYQLVLIDQRWWHDGTKTDEQYEAHMPRIPREASDAKRKACA